MANDAPANSAPVDEAALDALAELATPTVTAALGKLGFEFTYATGINPLAPPDGGRMVGRARTLRFIQKREDLVRAQYADLESSPHRSALESIEPGEVMVIDARGCLEAAVVGDIFTRRVLARGGRGIVIDGVCRDLTAIREVGLPLYARGVHGDGIDRRLMSVGSQEPVQIAEVAVMPGDIVLGDGDGVVMLPPHAVEEVIAGSLDARGTGSLDSGRDQRRARQPAHALSPQRRGTGGVRSLVAVAGARPARARVPAVGRQLPTCA